MEIKCPVTVGSYCYFRNKAGFQLKDFNISSLKITLDYKIKYNIASGYTLKDFLPRYIRPLVTLSYSKVPYISKGSPDYFRTPVNRTYFILEYKKDKL